MSSTRQSACVVGKETHFGSHLVVVAIITHTIAVSKEYPTVEQEVDQATVL